MNWKDMRGTDVQDVQSRGSDMPITSGLNLPVDKLFARFHYVLLIYIMLEVTLIGLNAYNAILSVSSIYPIAQSS